MGDDYLDAAVRHLADAELLFTQLPSRLANASHLFGLSAECSLKAIACQSKPGAAFRGSKGHIPKLFAELLNVAPGIAGNTQLAMHINGLEPSFTDWKVEQRYAPQATFDAQVVCRQQSGAQNAKRLMTNVLAGLI
ncbi:MAG: hypothetical protein PHU77_03640 [Simplicispira sp.]|nr:hypothetical protein [Simplicispira sp.]